MSQLGWHYLEKIGDVSQTHRSWPRAIFTKHRTLKKPFSIITYPEFLQANKALDAFVKTTRKDGEIAGIIHKNAPRNP